MFGAHSDEAIAQPVLNPTLPIERLPPLAMLSAYFDESADPTGRVFTLAGWVAVSSAWDHFTPAWRSMLRDAPHPAYAFHMKDIAHKDKQFSDAAGWTNDQRTAFVSRACDIILDDTTNKRMFGVGCTVVSDSAFGEKAKFAIKDLYMFCYLTVFVQVLEQFPIEMSIDFVFDEKEKVRKHVEAHFWDAKATLPPELRDRLGGCAFKDDVKLPPLQAADFLAYERRKRTQDRVAGIDRKRISYGRLLQRPHSFKCWDERLLVNMEQALAAHQTSGSRIPGIIEMLPNDDD